MTFHGRLLSQGRLVVDDVAGEIYEHASPTGLRDSAGEIQVPPFVVRAGTLYQLVTDDGRSFSILVDRVRHATGVAHFLGTTP